jgi:hypothetical protein
MWRSISEDEAECPRRTTGAGSVDWRAGVAKRLTHRPALKSLHHRHRYRDAAAVVAAAGLIYLQDSTKNPVRNAVKIACAARLVIFGRRSLDARVSAQK